MRDGHKFRSLVPVLGIVVLALLLLGTPIRLLNPIIAPGPVYIEDPEPVCPPAGYTAIYTPAGLQAINNGVTGHYALCNDINLSGVTWNPIANFSGILDGQGHTLSNLVLSGTQGYNGGLFKSIVGGTVRKLNLSNFILSRGYHSGLLAGTIGLETNSAVHSLVEEVNVSGNIQDCGGGYCGLLTGESYFATIQRVTTHGTIQSGITIGGIAGWASGTAFLDVAVSTTGPGLVAGQGLGGIVGATYGGVIERATFSGILDGPSTAYFSSSYIGGIAGSTGGWYIPTAPNLGFQVIRNARASGSLKGRSAVGGISGFVAGTIVVDAYSTMTIDTRGVGTYASQRIGGLFGEVGSFGALEDPGLLIKDSYYYGDIIKASTTTNVGGIVGKNNTLDNTPSAIIPLSNCFFLKDSEHNASLPSDNVNIGKTPAQLGTLSTFASWVDEVGNPKVSLLSDAACTTWELTQGSTPVLRFETGLTCPIEPPRSPS